MIIIRMEKKKLTLSVDSEVIEKAKKLGLNLSVITETALKMTTLGKGNEGLTTKEKLVQSYQKVFQTISPILEKWDTSIIVGEYSQFIDAEDELYDTFTYHLTSEGIYLWDEVISDETPLKEWSFTDKELPINKFHDPEKIIKALIDKLYSIEEENNVKIQKLEVITNLLKLSGLADENEGAK